MTTPNSLPVILLAFANDRANEARYLRNLPEELRHLREALRPAVDRKLCEVVELANATTEDIFKVFQSRKYRNRVAIFHFGGHAGGFRLPPPYVLYSTVMDNTRVPKLLAEAMAVLTDQTDDATRVTCLHSIMHAMLQLQFHEQSGKTLRQVLEHISSQCDSASLAEVLKSPWAIHDAQRIVLEILEDRSGEEFDGHYWAVHTHHEKLRLSIDDLESAVQFPEKLQDD